MMYLELHTKTKNRYESVLIAIALGSLVCVGAFFLMAYYLGDGSVYGTGYEFGKLMAYTAGKIQTSITKGIKLSGALLALFISLKRNKSILWAILHAAFGWLYILYFLYSQRGQEDH